MKKKNPPKKEGKKRKPERTTRCHTVDVTPFLRLLHFEKPNS